jgi:cell division protein FtsL
MPQVTFDEQQSEVRRKSEERTAMESLLMKTGLVKTGSQAKMLMVVICIVCISLTIYIIAS